MTVPLLLLDRISVIRRFASYLAAEPVMDRAFRLRNVAAQKDSNYMADSAGAQDPRKSEGKSRGQRRRKNSLGREP